MRLVAQLALIQNFGIVHMRFGKRLQVVTRGATLYEFIGLEAPNAIFDRMARRAVRRRRMLPEQAPTFPCTYRESHFRRAECKLMLSGGWLHHCGVNTWRGLRVLQRFPIEQQLV